jgi:hypothetical protein
MSAVVKQRRVGYLAIAYTSRAVVVRAAYTCKTVSMSIEHCYAIVPVWEHTQLLRYGARLMALSTCIMA